MEILFENKYTRDREWAKDILGYISFRRPLHIVLYIISAVSLVYGVCMLIFYYTLSIVSFLVPALWAGLLLYIYFKNLNVTLKRDIEINKKPIEVEVRVTNESIVQTQSTGSEFTLDFSDIKKIVKTKKFIYLWSKSNMLYSIKKEGFIVGSADDFLAFLKAKGFKC